MKRKERAEGLTVGMIAEQLHCCPETVRRAIKLGKIPAVRVNVGRRRGLIRIPASWLEETLKGGTAA